MMSTSALHRGFRWTDLPSTVPEGVATDEMLLQTPDHGSPAPWRIAGRGVWWSTRARSDDRELLPAALRRGARPLLRVGFAVTYSETPVGGYHELGGAILYARLGGVFGHIPFLPVDSAATMRGGRENWALPKVLADFSGDPVADSTVTVTGARPDGDWSVAITAESPGTSRHIGVPRFAAGSLTTRLLSAVSGLEQVDADGVCGRTGFDDLGAMSLTTAPTRIRLSTAGSPQLRRLFADRSYSGGTIDYSGVTLAAPRVR
ncbi:acetoacetate decarboxylase family protein [Williamsia serinedens]|uniref:Acetoacetate decarboxylase (ADC) n=1 Tax=Williamsia serinedens TaxID=391736 RepID=A0ABT1GXZ4_9NOCA|nr:acetoacetate decarboxylase family protein [Williamsia serinedens]MCP2159857.1 Acetoacetate decarboxylase (ADC) [Williamsia serinedens]